MPADTPRVAGQDRVRFVRVTAAAFWSRVDVRADNECWPWLGPLRDKGYGMARFESRTWNASRLAWRLTAGVTPPTKMFVCHTCHNRACCNPRHLYLGDAFTNNRDTVDSGRNHKSSITHCPQGHEYSGQNVYALRSAYGFRRECKTCRSNRGVARRAAKRRTKENA